MLLPSFHGVTSARGIPTPPAGIYFQGSIKFAVDYYLIDRHCKENNKAALGNINSKSNQ